MSAGESADSPLLEEETKLVANECSRQSKRPWLSFLVGVIFGLVLSLGIWFLFFEAGNPNEDSKLHLSPIPKCEHPLKFIDVFLNMSLA